MPRYELAKSIQPMIDTVMEQYHGDLFQMEARVHAEWAWLDTGEGEGGPPAEAVKAAVTHNGYPCEAKIKKTSYRDRARGWPDAWITIDKRNWNSLTEPEQLALLDHELHHLDVVRDKDGNLKADDLGRPVLAVRRHDVQIGWFEAIARRHGESAPEVRNTRALLAEYEQLRWAFAEDAGDGDDEETGEPAGAAHAATA